MSGLITKSSGGKAGKSSKGEKWEERFMVLRGGEGCRQPSLVYYASEAAFDKQKKAKGE